MNAKLKINIFKHFAIKNCSTYLYYFLVSTTYMFCYFFATNAVIYCAERHPSALPPSEATHNAHRAVFCHKLHSSAT